MSEKKTATITEVMQALSTWQKAKATYESCVTEEQSAKKALHEAAFPTQLERWNTLYARRDAREASQRAYDEATNVLAKIEVLTAHPMRGFRVSNPERFRMVVERDPRSKKDGE